MDDLIQKEIEEFDKQWPSVRSYTGGKMEKWIENSLQKIKDEAKREAIGKVLKEVSEADVFHCLECKKDHIASLRRMVLVHHDTPEKADTGASEPTSDDIMQMISNWSKEELENLKDQIKELIEGIEFEERTSQ